MTDAEFLRNVTAAISGAPTKLHGLVRGNLSCLSTDAISQAEDMLAEAVGEEGEEGDPESDLVPALFWLGGYLHGRRERERGLAEGT